MERALGTRQADLLTALTHRNSGGGESGIWHRRCGWNWISDLITIKTLEGLRKRGLVRWDPDLAALEYTPANQTYRITPEGLAKVQQLKEKAP